MCQDRQSPWPWGTDGLVKTADQGSNKNSAVYEEVSFWENYFSSLCLGFFKFSNKEKWKYILLQHHDEGWVYLLVFEQLKYHMEYMRGTFSNNEQPFPHSTAITPFPGSAQRKGTQTNTAPKFWSSSRWEDQNAWSWMPKCALEIWTCSLSVHLWLNTDWNTHGVKLHVKLEKDPLKQ